MEKIPHAFDREMARQEGLDTEERYQKMKKELLGALLQERTRLEGVVVAAQLKLAASQTGVSGEEGGNVRAQAEKTFASAMNELGDIQNRIKEAETELKQQFRAE